MEQPMIFQDEEREILRLVEAQHTLLRSSVCAAFAKLRDSYGANLQMPETRSPLSCRSRADASPFILPEDSYATRHFWPELGDASLAAADAESDKLAAVRRTVQPAVVGDSDPLPFHRHSASAPEASVSSPVSSSSPVLTNGLSTMTGGAGREKTCSQKVYDSLNAMTAVALLLNTVLLLLELEADGWVAGYEVGASTDTAGFLPVASQAFRVFDGVFDLFFLAELLIRLAIERGRFCTSRASTFSALLSIGGMADLGFLLALGGDLTQASEGLHFVRAFNALRVLRLLRVFEPCAGLQSLLRACQSFLQSLFWAMMLLTVLMVALALALGNLLQSFLRDAEANSEDQLWIWKHYGTALRSLLTVFEVTFAGSWPAKTRPVLDKVSYAFSVIFVVYVTTVVFAIIRIITAEFLRDTMEAAQSDADMQVAKGLKKKAEYVRKLESMFQAIDATGDGMITQERLATMLANPKVQAYFQTLEVDVHESTALFHILDDGDGKVTCDEFINGIMRCKGAARAIDQVAMLAELHQLDKKLVMLMTMLEQCGVIHVEGGRRASVVNQAEFLKVFRMAESPFAEDDVIESPYHGL